LLVLGEPARLAAIHEGFDVTFGYRGCDYVLVAYGLDRVEVRRFAESLKDTAGPTFTQLTPSPSVAPFTGAIWPEDTYAAAAAACTARPDWRSSSGTIALAFASQVLGWTGRAHTERMVVRDSKNEVVMRQEGVAADARVRGIVHVYTTEPVAGCWSVKSVSRPPDRRPTGVSVAIRGRTAEIGFASFGAASAAVEVGYGGRNRRTTWRPSDGGPATFDLDFDPDTRGHFLVLLKDARGRVFSASGGPLPAGDFVAG
jgi:hypothetical protein